MGRASRGKKKYSNRLEFKNENQKERTPPGKKDRRFNRLIFHCLLIIIIGLLAYSNSFHSPFQWDEEDFIVQNPVVQNLEYFLNPSKAKGIDPDFYIFLKTRYIGYLTFALNYKLNGFDVLGYHIFNLTIHLLNAIFVYTLIRLTFRTPFLRESLLKKHLNLISLFSALFFVSHPVQTEAVTYIFQRHASFVAFFYLLSLVFYIQWRLKSEEKETSHFHSTLLYGLSLLSVVFAMITKENAFTLPFTIMVYEFFFFTGPIKVRVFRLIPFFLTLTIIPFTHIGIDKPIGEIINHIIDPSLLLIKEVSKEVYLLTQFRVIMTYIRLLFLPIHQNLDYDYPIYSSFFTPPVFLSFLFHLTMLGLAVYAFYQSKRKIPDWRFTSFGIFWFFITLSVESSIIPLQMIICEYRIYLPSVGFFMAVTTSLFIVMERFKVNPSTSRPKGQGLLRVDPERRFFTPLLKTGLSASEWVKFPQLEKYVMMFLVFLVVLLSVLTYARNIVWTDQISMWEDVTRKSPNNARGHYNLGLAYGKQRRFEEAIKEFQTTLSLKPNHAKAHNNLGLIYDQLGRRDDAIKELQTALHLNPNDANVHYNLGVIFGRQGRLDDAMREFQTSLKFNPNNANAHNNLGVIFVQQGRWEDAIKEFQTALKLNPNHINAQNNLRKVLIKSR